MLALGFSLKWVDWVMMCVTSVSFAVLINDQPFGLINPQRGLRQGDPLSPFLFVLCTEGLTHLLNVAERNGLISGMKFSEEGPTISHLLFADDSLFLCKASVSEASVLQRILTFYGEATGQTINREKSSISFGDKVGEESRAAIQHTLGISNQGGASKYLGLPECFSGSKVDLFSYLKDKTHGKLDVWYYKHLSQAGKEVLIKSSGSSLSTFAMSCFRLPKSIIDKLTSMLAAFWWGAEPHQRKIHWVAWERLCLPKDQGGLGFRDLEAFNQAMLAKQAWKVLSQPDSMLARFLKSRYFPDGEFLSAPLGLRPSYAWRSLLHGRELLTKGIIRRVGNGQKTRVWIDKWIDDPVEGMRAPWIKNYFFDVNLIASSLIDSSTRLWNPTALCEIFVPGDVQMLLKNQPAVLKEDFYSWKLTRSGQFSVKTAYNLAFEEKTRLSQPEAFNQPSINPLKEKVWKVLTVPKIKVFLWKALNGGLSVAELMEARGMKVDSGCQVCGGSTESINHILFECPLARLVWAISGIPNPENGFHQTSIFVNFSYLLSLEKKRKVVPNSFRVWPWILWSLWKSRNELLFRGFTPIPSNVMLRANQDADEWFEAQVVEEKILSETQVNIQKRKEKWKPPPKDWSMCNVGFDWNKSKNLAGGGWVIRNERGVVLCHSRRAFSNIQSRDQAKLVVILWALESMESHRMSHIIIAGEFCEMFGAVERPQAWPSFLHFAGEIGISMARIVGCKLQVVSREANRGASFIAQSVTKQGLVRSYVQTGYPPWLFEFFVNESRYL